MKAGRIVKTAGAGLVVGGSNNTLGGTTNAARNIIAANVRVGVLMQGSAADIRVNPDVRKAYLGL